MNRLQTTPEDHIDINALQLELNDPKWHINIYDHVSSTMEVVQRLAADGAPYGTVAIAKTQSAGYGRHGRIWQSPRGGVWLTALLPPRLIGETKMIDEQRRLDRDLHQWNITLARQIAFQIGSTLEIPVQAVEPNDLFLAGRKVGGILCQTVISSGQLQLLLAGVGINVNNRSSDLKEVEKPAISIKDYLGRAVSLNRVITAILIGMAKSREDERMCNISCNCES
ncbi:biotin--[acetyl-CoA-carboxylase] ligase [Candidatus Acetothermia bacterium]|nr:biotin--[acetyl-CoA-carboxylase] ligase [Candidatus Acetothermia bacterium]